MNSPLLVVAAVLERDGKILIGQRKREAKNHPLRWEFPGGKVEAGETPEEGLARELREELGIEALIGMELDSYEFVYPGNARTTHLLFYRVTEFQGTPRNLDFEQIVWISRADLRGYDFLEGDRQFVERLASNGV